MQTVLVTGSSGLVGSACVRHYHARGHKVYGLDSNARRSFFGADGDTAPTLQKLLELPGYIHSSCDIRNRLNVFGIWAGVKPDVVIHCAAQPSHDWATKHPVEDFEVNATGTLNVLEATRQFAPDASFVFASTNKVYGDAPNRLTLQEYETRYELTGPQYRHGFAEGTEVDQSRHSVFGASKLSADVLVQEYARTFGMRTGVFRMGCVTGAAHAGAELHGFLAYLARCVREGRKYTVHGYGGKQVRDQIHADDVASAFAAFAESPNPGEVYNLGGGWQNSVSVLEAIATAQALLHRPLDREFCETPRGGDHCVYYSDFRKFQSHYPKWSLTRDLGYIFEELCRQ